MRHALLIFALWLAEMAGSFESAMILAALKALLVDFGDPTRVGWLLTGYLIVGAAFAAIIGRLGDLYGRQRVLLFALALGALGSIVSAVSETYSVLLVGRLIQGVTAAALPLCIALIREHLAEAQASTAIGLIVSGASIGTAMGLVLGGFIVDNYSWHEMFYASGLFCAVAFIAVVAFVPRGKRGAHVEKTNWLTGLLFAPGIALVLFYLTLGKSWGWAAPSMIGSLCAGIALLGWWVRASLADPNPLIDVRTFANRSVATVCIVTALVSMSTLQITVFFSLLLQAPTWTFVGLGLSATAAGLVKLPSNISSVIAAPLGGWLAGRGGGRLAMIAGGLITALGWSLVLFDASSVPVIIGELIIISFGATMLFAVGPAIVAQVAPENRVGEVSGLLAVVRGLFLAIGAQLVTIMLSLDGVVRGTETFPSPDAFRGTAAAIVAVCLVAVVVSAFLPGRKSSVQSAREV